MKIATALALAGALLTMEVGAASSGWDGKKLYRYTNENGVKVLDDVVPPRYVAGGYEVLTISGRVLEVVEPELTGPELAEKERREAQMAADLALLKRYNSVADIESARKRKLAIVQQDVAILRSNISSLNRQIKNEESAAARIQRNGGTVSAEQMERIGNLRKEVDVVNQRLSMRNKEAVDINSEFDQATSRYREIAGK
ncbi:hypothetical protein [Microbulbifer agarilyticus]|uniref:hypothetical protein n=1 Tax=Microbulbifer agarilyticus TaxID=260552 RepID=UPI001C957507|nr:hypothetical protein [Microbulbifer agarilyticus]MBY6190945.1 hypothetical protein [Microbulbifer agarilyticus]MBY6211552.1 hypothetical protein [Microbulbifer agarilyticus]MCA0893431.1 hypothetical protein [Microbulbifer agarilyticus]